jgi:hypothetical protein
LKELQNDVNGPNDRRVAATLLQIMVAQKDEKEEDHDETMDFNETKQVAEEEDAKGRNSFFDVTTANNHGEDETATDNTSPIHKENNPD